jgi:hypothetical protein
VEEFESDYTGRHPGAAPVLVHDGSRIAKYAEYFPDIFAGQWLEDGTSWIVAFTDDIGHHLSEIRKAVFAPDKVTVVRLDTATDT